MTPEVRRFGQRRISLLRMIFFSLAILAIRKKVVTLKSRNIQQSIVVIKLLPRRGQSTAKTDERR